MTDDTAADQSFEATAWNGGFSWLHDPEEDAGRASHALATDGGVVLVDPLDTDGLDERVAELGELTGVVVIQDRHTRDAAAVAERHDVPVGLPDWMELGREKLDATAESASAVLSGTAYELQELLVTDEWEEALLVDESGETMVVPEALGTLPAFDGDGDSLGLHPALDDAPEGLAGPEPERVLVGHGESVHEGASEALAAALER